MLNGHKSVCPGCDRPLTELAISFLEFTNMDTNERNRYRERCRDEIQLQKLRAASRMPKGSKAPAAESAFNSKIR